MKTNRILYITALSLIGLSICISDTFSTDTMVRNHQSDESPLKRKREAQGGDNTISHSKIQKIQPNKNASSLPVEREVNILNTKSENSLDQLIAAGVQKYPLPAIKTVQDDLLESGFLDNMEKWINEAINKKDSHAMMVIGGLYHSNMDFDKAKPFIFWGAKNNDGEAFWLLNCMWRKGELENVNEALGNALLIKAKELNSENAAIYLGEMAS